MMYVNQILILSLKNLLKRWRESVLIGDAQDKKIIERSIDRIESLIEDLSNETPN